MTANLVRQMRTSLAWIASTSLLVGCSANVAYPPSMPPIQIDEAASEVHYGGSLAHPFRSELATAIDTWSAKGQAGGRPQPLTCLAS
jgi:hypothetical protein